MRFYSFCVYHREINTNGLSGLHRWHTQYTYKADNELSPNSLSYIASHLVTAERPMLFNQSAITHTVAFEVNPEKEFDSQTVTHLLLHEPNNHTVGNGGLVGLRNGFYLGPFFGLRYSQHAKEGENVYNLFPACVGFDDVMNARRPRTNDRAMVLDMKGPLAKTCWPFYRNMLAQMPKIQSKYIVDRFGKLKENPDITSGRRINFATDLQRSRMAFHRRHFNHDYVREVMHYAIDQMCTGMRRYYHWMNNFDHKWHDTLGPTSVDHRAPMINAASVWQQLWPAFGFVISPGTILTANQFTHSSYASFTVPFNSVKLKSHHRQIHTCLMELFAAHQQMCELLGLGKQLPSGVPAYYYWRNGASYPALTLGDAIYNDWDNWTALLFTVVDQINVLYNLMIVDAPRKRHAQMNATHRWSLRTGPTSYVSTPAPPIVTPILEIYPLPKEPYILPELPPPPTPVEPDAQPTSETIAGFEWDSGNPDADEDEESALQQATRKALAKLETVRRWIGKIREQMPWYKGIPLEKIPPTNDDAANPFTGTPIESP